MDLDSHDDTLNECIRKSIPSHRYINELSDDSYLKLIGKDAYAFIKGKEEELIEVIGVGKEVSQYFKTLSPDQVKEVYRIILKAVQDDHWSLKEMSFQLQSKFPFLSDDESFRIIKNETWRVLQYVKAQSADDDYLYSWIGPLNDRTTPMCYYLQTGELRDSDRKALERAGHTPSDLPIVPEEGFTIDALKDACHRVAECFGHDMISEWMMHINCRHTFARGRKLLPAEIETPIDITPDDYTPLPDDGLETVLEQPDEFVMPTEDDYDTYRFTNSMYEGTILYGQGERTIDFGDMSETELAGWSRLIRQLKDDRLDDMTITWAVADMGGMDEDTVGYIVSHCDEIYERAVIFGWID